MKKETVILFQGDSITDGGRLRDKKHAWDLNHQIGHCYAYLISARLGADYPKAHLTFYDRGVSGNRIADLYGRWKEDTLNLHPDILSILVGINDCGSTISEQAGSDPVRFAKIYQLLLEETKNENPDVKIVLMEPFILPVGDRKTHYEQWNSLIAPLQEATQRIAEKNNAVFVPLQERFRTLCELREPEYWVWDGVHPTVSGHQVIADEWLRYAGGLLQTKA